MYKRQHPGQVSRPGVGQVVADQPLELLLIRLFLIGAGTSQLGMVHQRFQPFQDLQQRSPLPAADPKVDQLTLPVDLGQFQSRAKVAWRPWAWSCATAISARSRGSVATTALPSLCT